jgi:hypothetical protein
LIEEENRGESAASPELSNEDEDSSDSGEEDSGSSSDDGSDGDQTFGHDGNFPKVDITGKMFFQIIRALEAASVYLYIHLVCLNSCFVNFNLRRSCKLGLRET